ncbi:hypothetical protein [Pedobacter xixiisoli]|uniref:Uncharacterized protein n=1 Tax=Pedobacter xixiisoli TaxID=1476464 RepID=A0A285ZRE3_9SPHI|nr:hypothetical protein [Pedobacter xixiisoli]SOD12236.1 hypothetical protein SAMN06297358_0563 [Pedobacter xixiisoli]
METPIKLELPEDFIMICEIFEIRPQEFIQKILDEISLPRYYSGQNGKEIWSTLIMLEHLDTIDFSEEKLALHEPYMEKLHNIVSQKPSTSEEEVELTETEARNLMVEWHKAILAYRSKYLLDGLSDDV